MAKVKGMKEKLHSPLYDAFFVPASGTGSPPSPPVTFGQTMTDPRVIRFFVDVQNKTRLETNLQAAGVLPSLNTFEARAMRVVASTPPPSALYSPPALQPSPADFLSELIYNSVTSLLVGEKVMIEMPTFYFPAGAGVSPGNGTASNHGEPDPMATFRFAEPVLIEPQQNFRVEMLFPRDVPLPLKNTVGPLRVWVVLDGYLTRDVQ
jgi:hypothetical protein